MKVIYHSYFGTFAAYVMAAMHAGIYDINKTDTRIVKKHYKMCLKYSNYFGNLIYVGLDEEFREIYVIGCKKFGDVIKRAHTGMKSLYNIGEGLHFVDVSKVEGVEPIIIMLLNNKYSLYKAGERLFNMWIRRKYSLYGKKVQEEIKRIKGVEEQ